MLVPRAPSDPSWSGATELVSSASAVSSGHCAPPPVCGFGCGRVAVQQLKNGRFVCAEFVAQCPAMREKNSVVKRGRNPWEGREHPRGMAGKSAWNRGLTWAGSGRGKKGWFRGYWCDSTYELVFVAYALDHDIRFERNLEVFPYEYANKIMRWIPDFRLEDGTYVEIKGYLSAQALAKFEFFYRPLLVLAQAELREMFEYVWQTYGRNLVALYE
jgi:hypothetical protein